MTPPHTLLMHLRCTCLCEQVLTAPQFLALPLPLWPAGRLWPPAASLVLGGGVVGSLLLLCCGAVSRRGAPWWSLLELVLLPFLPAAKLAASSIATGHQDKLPVCAAPALAPCPNAAFALFPCLICSLLGAVVPPGAITPPRWLPPSPRQSGL